MRKYLLRITPHINVVMFDFVSFHIALFAFGELSGSSRISLEENYKLI